MPASFDGWTVSSIPNSYGASSSDRHKPDGQESFVPTMGEDNTWSEAAASSQSVKAARQDIRNSPDGNTWDINPAPQRVDVQDMCQTGCIPVPFAGEAGSTLDFNLVGDRASDQDHGANAPDGRGAPGASRGVLGEILD